MILKDKPEMEMRVTSEKKHIHFSLHRWKLVDSVMRLSRNEIIRLRDYLNWWLGKNEL